MECAVKGMRDATGPSERAQLYDVYAESRDYLFGLFDVLISEAPRVQMDSKTEAGQHKRNDWVAALRYAPKKTARLDDVKGLGEIAELLRLYITPAADEKPFPQASGGRRVLLYGPPGTGKTLLAYAAANEANLPFLNVRITDILSKYVGESERRLADIFDYAEAHEPMVIHIEEIDAIGRPNFLRLRATLLPRLDGLGTKDEKKRTYLVASTNMPWALDAALLRRFQHKFYIAPPDKKAKLEILEQELRKIAAQEYQEIISQDFSANELLELLEADARGVWTGSDISVLVEDAFDFAARDFKFRAAPRHVERRHFMEAFERATLATNKETLARYTAFTNI